MLKSIMNWCDQSLRTKRNRHSKHFWYFIAISSKSGHYRHACQRAQPVPSGSQQWTCAGPGCQRQRGGCRGHPRLGTEASLTQAAGCEKCQKPKVVGFTADRGGSGQRILETTGPQRRSPWGEGNLQAKGLWDDGGWDKLEHLSSWVSIPAPAPWTSGHGPQILIMENKLLRQGNKTSEGKQQSYMRTK